MAGKAIWKGYIHFKDIDVAVKLHTAVKEDISIGSRKTKSSIYPFVEKNGGIIRKRSAY